MTKAYRTLLGRAKATGLEVKKHVLNHECSNSMKELIRSECMLELVPPHCHRRNIAEATIKNFKNHFISILTGTDPNFPLKLWDKLLPQTGLALNLLRQSNAAPTISAQAHLFGNVDFNRMPLAPMGCTVQIHEEASQRRTWAPHSPNGYYLGTSPDHYRAHRIYVKATNAERVSEIVFFKHKYLTNPTVTHADRIVQAARELYNALSKKKQGMDKTTMEDLRELSKMYLKTAERSDAREWVKEATHDPVVPQKPKVTFSDEVTVIPTNSTPRRVTREVANLDPITVVGNSRSPARNTRAKFAVAAAALAAIVNGSTGNTAPWLTSWNLIKLHVQYWKETRC